VRLSFLDSIRGIASLIVVTAHLHFAAQAQTWFFELWILRAFKASVFAVSIFFVLSGLVLYLQIEGKKVNYIGFVIRRAFRLFPACIAAVTISYLIYLIWTPQPLGHAEYLNDVTWPSGISFERYLDHLWLSGAAELLRPIWSLVIEWRVSLIFPVIVMLFLWSPIFTGVAAAGLALTIASLPHPTFAQNGYASVAPVAFYSCLFVFGIFIAAYRFQIVLFLRPRPSLRGALIVFCGYYVWFRSSSNDQSGYLLQGIVSGALIAFCMSTSKARKLLRIKPLQYLGRISYSLYLIHMIWIGILFRLLDGTNPLVISAAVIVASLLSADLMNRFIEAPANRFGRRVAALIQLPSFLGPTAQPVATDVALK
jgi:peptidoglycan/LPS O-acetylase OafA/YrhL